MRKRLLCKALNDENEFVEGYYCKIGKNHFIIKENGEKVKIKYKSLSQYIGYDDIDGTPIFEHDVVVVDRESDESRTYGMVKYKNGFFVVWIYGKHKNFRTDIEFWHEKSNVVGNIKKDSLESILSIDVKNLNTIEQIPFWVLDQ